MTKQIDDLNEDLKVRQESINILKDRLKSQITSFRETIAKVLDKDTSLAEKIRTLFREQGIMIASILTATHLMEKQAKLRSSSEIAGADEIELEEIAKSTEELIFQKNKQSQTDELLYASC